MPSIAQFRVDRPSVVSECIDGEAVILDLRRGLYFSIRGTGALIWAGVEAGLDAAVIAHSVAVAFPDAKEHAVAATETFLAELVEQNLVIPGPEPHPVHVDLLAHDGVFRTPVLERYSDMEDLLLLDPIHDVEAAGWPQRRADSEAV